MSAAPTPYTRVNNFVSDATNNPSITVAGIATDLDSEYEAIKTSVNQTISRLNEIQRADGKLRSNVLDPAEYTAITAAVSGAVNAGASATAAASSAASASTSATTATNRAAEASTSSSNAAGNATLAGQRAAAAAASATNATASEANAINRASAASTSATAAATSATSASNSAGTASTKATEAAASAAGAASSASTASTKATEAAASAASVAGQTTIATNAATSATSSAATATTKANNAADSAVSSQNSADISTTKAAEAALSALDASTASTLAGLKAAEAVTTVATLNSANAETLTNANSAASSATAAATSATASATSATSSATSATNASTSATNAATSATSANTALASVNLIFDTFDDRFLGSKPSDPTVDNDGNAILAGAVYYNSTAKDVRFFNGVTWDSPNASATSSATASAASATAAATSATNAATSATNAATSATNAATSATGAATSAANAAASYDNFDDRYLGPKATAPTVDNDGSALLVGALYWSTSGPSTNKMMVWTGSAWNEAFSGEPAIPTGTTSQFWRGDKTWQAITSPLETQLTGFSVSTTEAGVVFSGGGYSNVLIPYVGTYNGKRQYYLSVPDTQHFESTGVAASTTFFVSFSSTWTVDVTWQEDSPGDGYSRSIYSSTGNTEYPWEATWSNVSVTRQPVGSEPIPVVAADTILNGVGKLQSQISLKNQNFSSDVRNTELTGLTPYVGTIQNTDNILNGFSKLAGNAAASLIALRSSNKIINGGMQFNQRAGLAYILAPASPFVYTLDRWQARNEAASTGQILFSQSTDAPPGFSNSLRAFVQTTTNPSISNLACFSISQSIEGFNIADLKWGTASAISATLSFWVKSSTRGSGALPLVIQNNSFDRAYGASYLINQADVWEYKTITIPAITDGTWNVDNEVGVRVIFGLGAGGSKTISAGWNTPSTLELKGGVLRAGGQFNFVSWTSAELQITGVQLEAGSVATPFENNHYESELALCQRYYQTPNIIVQSSSGSTGSTVFSANWPVQMRATPTAAFSGSSPTVTRFGWRAGPGPGGTSQITSVSAEL